MKLIAESDRPTFGGVLHGYAGVADVYLALWEAQVAGSVETQLPLSARQACKNLHSFAKIFPIGKPGAFLYQGLYDWLSGKPKKRETLFGLVRSLKALRSRFGKVYVNFGEPIDLSTVLDSAIPDWRDRELVEGERPAWAQPAVRKLGDLILTQINAAAAINPVNLVATALLSTPRRSMLEVELVKLLDLHLAILSEAPYSPQVTVCDLSARKIVDYTEQFGLLKRQPHKLGDIMSVEEGNAALISYFRNNVAHLFALPSLIACCFLESTNISEERILDLLRRVYPYIQGELHLRWHREELEPVVRKTLDVMIDRGLIYRDADSESLKPAPLNTAEAVQLSVIARSALQALERYYVTVALLMKHGPGVLTQPKLEELCHLMAQRISMLYQLNAPEFFDRRLFRGFIGHLRHYGVITVGEDSRIEFGDALRRADSDARTMLGESLRHNILQAVYL